MPNRFYKHKILLDENLDPRQKFAILNERFDVKHIKHDLHFEGMADALIYELALEQDRIILTINVSDFKPLLTQDSPGIIGIPEAWSADRIDTKLTALFTKQGAKYFRGSFHPLGATEDKK